MVSAMLYDADCGICTSSALRAQRWGSDLDVTSWQSRTDLAELGISPDAAAETLHVVDGTTIYTGHRAIARILRGCRPAWARLAGRLLDARPLAPVAAAAYSLVARNRSRLPGSTCAVPPR